MDSLSNQFSQLQTLVNNSADKNQDAQIRGKLDANGALQLYSKNETSTLGKLPLGDFFTGRSEKFEKAQTFVKDFIAQVPDKDLRESLQSILNEHQDDKYLKLSTLKEIVSTYAEANGIDESTDALKALKTKTQSRLDDNQKAMEKCKDDYQHDRGDKTLLANRFATLKKQHIQLTNRLANLDAQLDTLKQTRSPQVSTSSYLETQQQTQALLDEINRKLPDPPAHALPRTQKMETDEDIDIVYDDTISNDDAEIVFDETPDADDDLEFLLSLDEDQLDDLISVDSEDLDEEIERMKNNPSGEFRLFNRSVEEIAEMSIQDLKTLQAGGTVPKDDGTIFGMTPEEVMRLGDDELREKMISYKLPDPPK